MLTALQRCPECSKTFPSDKALHGHMRLHPGRPYRGVNPLNNTTKRKKAASMKCLTSCSNSKGESDSNAGKSWETSKPNNSHGQYKQILNFRAELEAFYKDWDTEKYYEGDGLQYKARYIRTLDLELYDPRFRKFCKRLISEALKEEEEGGIKTISTPTMAMSNGTGNGMSIGMINVAPTKAAKVAFEAKTYICKTCLEGFSSSQALGGHQRLHYRGPLNCKSVVKWKVGKSGPRSSPASTHGLLGLAANDDEYIRK